MEKAEEIIAAIAIENDVFFQLGRTVGEQRVDRRQKPFATGPWKAGGGTDGGTVTGRIINPPCEIRTQIFGK